MDRYGAHRESPENSVDEDSDDESDNESNDESEDESDDDESRGSTNSDGDSDDSSDSSVHNIEDQLEDLLVSAPRGRCQFVVSYNNGRAKTCTRDSKSVLFKKIHLCTQHVAGKPSAMSEEELSCPKAIYVCLWSTNARKSRNKYIGS